MSEIKEIRKKLDNHEKRISKLEKKPKSPLPLKIKFNFKNKNLHHSKLLYNLLSSEYCHQSKGLIYEEILEVFDENHRPVRPKKIRDLLGKWVERKKCETRKKDKKLAYFIIKMEKRKK